MLLNFSIVVFLYCYIVKLLLCQFVNWLICHFGKNPICFSDSCAHVVKTISRESIKRGNSFLLTNLTSSISVGFGVNGPLLFTVKIALISVSRSVASKNFF